MAKHVSTLYLSSFETLWQCSMENTNQMTAAKIAYIVQYLLQGFTFSSSSNATDEIALASTGDCRMFSIANPSVIHGDRSLV